MSLDEGACFVAAETMDPSACERLRKSGVEAWSASG
jgi:hypothetical protein